MVKAAASRALNVPSVARAQKAPSAARVEAKADAARVRNASAVLQHRSKRRTMRRCRRLRSLIRFPALKLQRPVRRAKAAVGVVVAAADATVMSRGKPARRWPR